MDHSWWSLFWSDPGDGSHIPWPWSFLQTPPQGCAQSSCCFCTLANLDPLPFTRSPLEDQHLSARPAWEEWQEGRSSWVRWGDQKTKRTDKKYNFSSSRIPGFWEWPLIRPHVWYAEPPACAARRSDPGKQSPSAAIRGWRGNGLSSSPEAGKCVGMQKNKQVQPSTQEADGAEQHTITVKGLMFLQFNLQVFQPQKKRNNFYNYAFIIRKDFLKIWSF